MDQQDAGKLQALITGAMAGMVQEIVVHVADAATKYVTNRMDEWLKQNATAHLDAAFMENMRDLLLAADWFPAQMREAVKEGLDDSGAVEQAVENHDFSSAIDRAMQSYDFSDDMERAVDRHDFDHDIQTALDNFDFDERMERVINNYDFDETIDRRLDEVLTEKIDEYDFANNAQFNEEIAKQVGVYIDTKMQYTDAKLDEMVRQKVHAVLLSARITVEG